FRWKPAARADPKCQGYAAARLWLDSRTRRQRVSLIGMTLDVASCRAATLRRPSDDMLRRELACARVAQLDLHGRMCDLKLFVKLMVQPAQKFVAGVALRHHEMARQRGFGRAHRPYMQVVNILDVRQTPQVLGNLLRLDFRRDCAQRTIDRLSQQAPGTPNNSRGYEQAGNRISPPATTTPSETPASPAMCRNAARTLRSACRPDISKNAESPLMPIP